MIYVLIFSNFYSLFDTKIIDTKITHERKWLMRNIISIYSSNLLISRYFRLV